MQHLADSFHSIPHCKDVVIPSPHWLVLLVTYLWALTLVFWMKRHSVRKCNVDQRLLGAKSLWNFFGWAAAWNLNEHRRRRNTGYGFLCQFLCQAKRNRDVVCLRVKLWLWGSCGYDIIVAWLHPQTGKSGRREMHGSAFTIWFENHWVLVQVMREIEGYKTFLEIVPLSRICVTGG